MRGEETGKIRLAAMDMWKPFRNSTLKNSPSTVILFNKCRIMKQMGEALDKVRKREYGRVPGKGQKHALLSRKANLSLDGKPRWNGNVYPPSRSSRR
jgi:transposase